MSQQSKPITYTSPVEALQTTLNLVKTAQKVHEFNCSPVHIVEELAMLSKEQLMQMREDLERILTANKEIQQK